MMLRRVSMLALMETWIVGLTRARAVEWPFKAFSLAFMRMQVRDRRLWTKVKPDYPFGCKRILFSSWFLPALQRPNVELVTDPITRLSPGGIVTRDGLEREVDCIIYGTGFRTTEFMFPMEIVGAGGRSLRDAWIDGPHAHLGISVPGFSFLFFAASTICFGIALIV